MSLYDRPYMRDTPGTDPEASQTSIVTTLLVVTIAVFVLQQVLNVFFPGPMGYDNAFLSEWFALSGENFRQLKVWTVISYGFLHSTLGFWHILGNMLGLYFLGRILEPMIGRERFLLIYFGSMLLGGLVYLGFHFNNSMPVVGASGAVFGLMTLFCLMRPEQPITLLLFFIIPITMKPKWLLRISAAITIGGLILHELPGNPEYRMAHSAHLGGIIGGLLYYRFVHSRPGQLFGSSASQPSMELPEWFKRKKNSPVAREVTYQVNRSTSRSELQAEVDRILDKINATGFGSLSDGEKQTLDSAKEILK